MKTPVVLLGHGSKNLAAHEEFTQLRDLVRQLEPDREINLAYLQLKEPDLNSVIQKLVDEKNSEVIVIPVFLFAGNHIKEDIPELINDLKRNFPKLQIHFGRHLGPEWRIAGLVKERITVTDYGSKLLTDNGNYNGRPEFIQNPMEIESRSFEIIDRELKYFKPNWQPAEYEVIRRVVHTTADFNWAELIEFHPQAITAGIRALREGTRIVTDVRMSLVGIGKRPTEKFGSKVECYIDDPEIKKVNAETGKTRAMLGLAKACTGMERGIVVIGNAPTALVELADLITEGKARPDLIVGTPVGFVGAAESKELLRELGVPYIRTLGRKGGSTIAAAIVNALSRLAEQEL